MFNLRGRAISHDLVDPMPLAPYPAAAALIRSCVSGRSRILTPIARDTALATAAAVGPCPASPLPRKGWLGRSMISISTRSGTALKRMIG